MKKTHHKLPKIHPRGSWVLVKPAPQETENEYGLITPESVEKEQKARGEIIEMGPDVIGLKKGDLVLYGKYAGEEIQIANKQEQKDQVDFVLLLEKDVLATLEV